MIDRADLPPIADRIASELLRAGKAGLLSKIADRIASELLRAGKAGLLSKIGIDEVRAAVIGYLVSVGEGLVELKDVEPLAEHLLSLTTRKLVEKVG